VDALPEGFFGGYFLQMEVGILFTLFKTGLGDKKYSCRNHHASYRCFIKALKSLGLPKMMI